MNDYNPYVLFSSFQRGYLVGMEHVEQPGPYETEELHICSNCRLLQALTLYITILYHNNTLFRSI